MKKENLSIGQTVFIQKYSYRNNEPSEVYEAKIAKIGHIYFEIDDSWKKKFSIETMREKSDYMPCKSYLSMQEILDEKEHDKLYSEIQKFFGYGSGKSKELTLEQLRKIKNIIDEVA